MLELRLFLHLPRLLAGAARVHAQESPSESENGSEIVVTAQRRVERQIDVPVAVSAVSSALPDQTGIRDPLRPVQERRFSAAPVSKKGIT